MKILSPTGALCRLALERRSWGPRRPGRPQEPVEVLRPDLLGRLRSNLLELVHVAGGVEPLDVARVDVAEAMAAQPVGAEFGVVADVSEQLGVHRALFADHVADLAV